jgi:sporulation protein YlmC with PRC-barrel domain
MKINKNSPVITSDGQEIGRVSRVVIDPLLRDVTHLVIREEEMPAEEKLIPIELAAQSIEPTDGIRLQSIAADLELRPFEKIHYVPLTKEAAERANIPGIQARPVYFYPPVGEAWEGKPYPPRFSEQRYVAKTEQNISEESVSVRDEAGVITVGGEVFGRVEQFFVDSGSGRVTHYLIATGQGPADRKLVPVTWTSAINEAQVELKVSSDLLETLPPYQP